MKPKHEFVIEKYREPILSSLEDVIHIYQLHSREREFLGLRAQGNAPYKQRSVFVCRKLDEIVTDIRIELLQVSKETFHH